MPGHPAPSAEEEARLRRLIADARHESPVPADVAARLDEVLGRLEAGEDVPSGISGTGVLELAAARRRRAASMLVAAAAVIAVGIGLGQVVDLSGSGSGSDSSGTEGAVTAERDQERERSIAPDRGDTGEGGSSPGGAAANDELSPGATMSREEPPRAVVVVDRRLARVGDDSFSDDAAIVQRRAIRTGGGPSARVARLRAAPRPVARRWQDCAPAEWGEGIPVAVLYDGEPAVLAFRAPAGDSQVVDLLQCGTGGVLRSTTLPRR